MDSVGSSTKAMVLSATLAALSMFGIVYGIHLLSPFPSEAEARARRVREEMLERQRHADWLATEFKYMKDPRTNHCFVYLLNERGASLASMPCRRIPPALLATGTLPE